MKSCTALAESIMLLSRSTVNCKSFSDMGIRKSITDTSRGVAMAVLLFFTCVEHSLLGYHQVAGKVEASSGESVHQKLVVNEAHLDD